MTTQEELQAAIADDTTIELAADIYLSSQIDIDGITGLVINGNGFKIDAGASSSDQRRCMYIDGGSQVTMNQLSVTGGYIVSEVSFSIARGTWRLAFVLMMEGSCD